MTFPRTALLLAAWLGFCAPLSAAEPAPRAPITHAQGLVPVDPAVVEQAVESVLEHWNSPGFADVLAPDFPNRQALLSSLMTVPLDARLQLLGVGGVQTLEQVRDDGALVSLVRASARIVLQHGTVRREGTVELILRISREAPRQ